MKPYVAQGSAAYSIGWALSVVGVILALIGFFSAFGRASYAEPISPVYTYGLMYLGGGLLNVGILLAALGAIINTIQHQTEVLDHRLAGVDRGAQEAETAEEPDNESEDLIGDEWKVP